MPASRKILYVVQGIPGNNAPTKHAFAIADLLGRCGCEVEFLLAGIIDPGNPASKDTYDYPFEFPCELSLGRFDIAAKYFERLTSCLSIRAFKRSFFRLRPDLVVYYGIESRLASGIIQRCRDSGTPVLVDETDWFDARFDGDVAAWIVESSRSRRVDSIDSLADGVIAISPFFERHFSAICAKRGHPRVFFMPPLNRVGDALDSCEPPKAGSKVRECTRFFYAGSPAGGKDHFEGFFGAIARSRDDFKTRPEVHIVGISPTQAVEMFGDIARSSWLRFYGQLDHAEVIRMLRTADFGILFRRPERYARAGFSTKFAECMSNGVPMLCNAVGGADLVLENGRDGIVIPDCSGGSMDEALRITCNMDDSDLARMKHAAFVKARRLFSQETYIGPFRVYLDDFFD